MTEFPHSAPKALQPRGIAFVRGMGLSVAVVGIGIVVWLNWPKSLISHAEALFRAVSDGNPQRVFAFSASIERQRTGLDEAKYIRLWRGLIEPRLGRLRVLSRFTTALMPPGHQATVEVSVVNSHGQRWLLYVECFQGDSRPEAYVLRYLLLAWRLDYALETGSALESVHIPSAYLRGLSKDRTTLESLGVHGLVGYKANGHCSTWDELEERWRGFLPSENVSSDLGVK